VQEHIPGESTLNDPKEPPGRLVDESDPLRASECRAAGEVPFHLKAREALRQLVVDPPELVAHVPDVTLEKLLG
jgi:hypothetical protein